MLHSFTVTIVVLIIVIVIAYVSDDLKKSGTLDIGTETDVRNVACVLVLTGLLFVKPDTLRLGKCYLVLQSWLSGHAA